MKCLLFEHVIQITPLTMGSNGQNLDMYALRTGNQLMNAGMDCMDYYGAQEVRDI